MLSNLRNKLFPKLKIDQDFRSISPIVLKHNGTEQERDIVDDYNQTLRQLQEMPAPLFGDGTLRVPVAGRSFHSNLVQLSPEEKRCDGLLNGSEEWNERICFPLEQKGALLSQVVASGLCAASSQFGSHLALCHHATDLFPKARRRY